MSESCCLQKREAREARDSDKLGKLAAKVRSAFPAAAQPYPSPSLQSCYPRNGGATSNLVQNRSQGNRLVRACICPKMWLLDQANMYLCMSMT